MPTARSDKTFYHGHTYTANPIACAAALASLRVFEEENTLARVRGLLPQFRDGLERFRSLPIVGNVRRIGLIGAVELVKDRRTKEPFGARERIGLKIYREGLKRHLVLRPLGHIIYLFLPLCVRERELRFILDNAYAAVRAQSCGRRLRTPDDRPPAPGSRLLQQARGSGIIPPARKSVVLRQIIP